MLLRPEDQRRKYGHVACT